MGQDFRRLGDPGSDEFRVEAYPFYLLNRAVSRYNVIIDAELRGIGLDIPSWRVIMILGEQSPRPVAQISKLAVINLSTLVRLVERMTKAGLVSSSPCPDDGRVTQLSLTDLGVQKLAAARRATAPMYRKLIKGFSASEFARLLDMLNRLHDNLA